MNKPRVVITGIGPVSAIGVGAAAFADALRQGRSGIAPLTRFDPSPDGAQLAGELRDFAIDEYLESRKGYLDRAGGFALAALKLALVDAGLDGADIGSAGLVLGSAFGSLETMGLFYEDYLEKGPRLVKPVLFPHTYANTAISLAAIEFGIRGPHLNFAGGQVASGQAIAAGYDLIKRNKAMLVLAGGYEALNEFLLAAYEADGAFCATDDGTAWTAGLCNGIADGTLPGEGAGIVVLEEYEHAIARSATPYAELTGSGMTGGAGDLVGRAMRAALAESGVPTVNLLAASTSGWAAADCNEAGALPGIAGPSAAPPAILRLKAQTGDTLGASCALQTMAAAIALRDAAAGTSYPGLHLAAGAALGTNAFCALVNSCDPGRNVVSLALRAL